MLRPPRRCFLRTIRRTGHWRVDLHLSRKAAQKGVVLLYTISGYGKMVNVMILTNTQAYEANITAFVESITLKKPVKS